METKAPVKIITIDVIRAIAALGVFYYHNHMGSVLAKYSGLPFLARTDAFGAGYAVPLFFLISGYCIHLSNIKYIKMQSGLPLKEYYVRRFLRIYPPYIAALTFAILVNYIVIPGYTPGIKDIIVHIFSLQGFTSAYFNTINVVLWTITIELAFYVIYPLFYYIRFKYNLNCALAFTFLVSCLSIAYFLFKGNISLPEDFCVFNLWFAWCSGAFLADKKALAPDDLKLPVYLLLYVVILAVFICLNLIPNKLFLILSQFVILSWTGPMLFIMSLENWFQQRKDTWLVKLTGAIGLSSYSLYLLHEPLIAMKNFIVKQYFPVQFQTIGVALGVFIIPVIAWYSFKYIEQPFALRSKLTVGKQLKM